MVKFLISCIVILTSCFCSLGASAFLLEGRVEKRLSIPHIFHNGKMYPMYSKNYNIQVDLNELKSGDFMAGTGEFNKDKTALYVESINSVGLVDLLGIWHTSKWDVFEFLDFSRLNLYVSKVQLFNQEPSLFGFQTVRYSVSPGFSPNNWSILLVDPMGIQIGSLKISDGRHLEISILDQATGKVIQKLNLLKLDNSFEF